jgi:hypothetical protein
MGKASKQKTESNKAEDTPATSDAVQPDMPEDIREYKEKLEKKTGKKYTYRAPKKDLPSIPHMLAHGAPEDEGRPRTWLELIGYPAILVALFCLSFYIFWLVNPIENSRYKRGRFALPKKNKPPPTTAGGANGNMPKKSNEL